MLIIECLIFEKVGVFPLLSPFSCSYHIERKCVGFLLHQTAIEVSIHLALFLIFSQLHCTVWFFNQFHTGALTPCHSIKMWRSASRHKTRSPCFNCTKIHVIMPLAITKYAVCYFISFRFVLIKNSPISTEIVPPIQFIFILSILRYFELRTTRWLKC